MNDFETKELKLLPTSLQTILCGERLTREDNTKYLRMFSGDELNAVMNNIKATSYLSGVVYNKDHLLSGIAPRLLEIDYNKTAGRIYYIAPKDGKEIKEKFPETYVTKKIKRAVAEAKMTGRSVICVYKGEEDAATIKTFNLYHSKIVFNDYEEVSEAYLFVDSLSLKALQKYVIVEHRYFKNGIPMQKFEVVSCNWNNEASKETDRYRFEDDKIPREIIERFKNVNFGKEKEMPFESLGVFVIDNKAINTKWTSVNIPEASFTNCLDKMSQIECSNTFKEIDKALGRGRVMLPRMKNTSNQFIQTIGAGQNTIRHVDAFMDTTFMQPYDSMSMNESTPQPVQFQLRVEEWNSALREDISELCSIYGISVLDFDPRLLQQGQRTDDEINALTDITIQTVTSFRELNDHEFNKMLACICKAWGFDMPVTIKWDMKSIINPTKNAQLVQGLLASGLISRKEALKRLNPEYTDEEIEEELTAIEQERALQSLGSEF